MDWAKHFQEANNRPSVPKVRFGAEATIPTSSNKRLVDGIVLAGGIIGALMVGYAGYLAVKPAKRYVLVERKFEDRDTLPDPVSYTRLKLPESAKFRTAQGAMSHGILVSRGMDIRDGILRRA